MKTQGVRISNKISNKANISYVGLKGNVFINKGKDKTFPGDLNTDGINSYYLGRHIVRNGDRPQQTRRTPDPLSEFANLHKDVIEKFDINIDKMITVNGCFKTNKSTIQRTMIPDSDSEFCSLPSLDKIKKKELSIKSAIRKLKIPQLAKCEIDDILTSKFNMNTYAGFTFDEYLGMKSKDEALNDALLIAKKRWQNIENRNKKNELIKRNEIFPHTFTVGARNKREDNYENGEEVKSRAVHMPEFHGELCDAPWIDQITDYIKFSKKGPIYIGNNIAQYDRLYRDFINCKQIIEGDVVKFDSSLFITDIIIAVAISRLYYDINDDSIDNHFLAIFDTVGIKDYITPGGYMYRLIHGLPSGVKSTSVFGSIINLINLLHCTRSISHKKMNFSVGGDDFLIGIKHQKFDDIIDTMLFEGEQIGYTFKLLKEKDFSNEDFDERPVFYKYTIDRMEPVVPPKVILERMLFPWNKNYTTNSEILKFLFELIPSLGAPRTSCYLFYKLYAHMYRQVLYSEITIGDVYKLHKHFYEKVLKYGLPIKDRTKGVSTFIYDKIVDNFTSSFNIFRIFKTRFRKKDCLFIKRSSDL